MHPRTSHDVETCQIAKELLQEMMNRGQIEVYSAKKEERDVCIQSDDRNPSKSDKAVPWKYAAPGSDGRKDASIIRVKVDPPSSKVTNISSTSGMTRSG